MKRLDKQKRRWGDRKDAYLVRKLDPLHIFMPYILPKRSDNEAVMTEIVNIEKVNEYLKEKNSKEQNFKYTLFHVICAAIAKTIVLRPRMNRFIAGHRLYQRKAISFAFVIKKQFTDEAEEALAIIEIDQNSELSPLEQIHTKVKKQVFSVRKKGDTNKTANILNVVSKIPRFVLRIVMWFLRILDYYGKIPASLSKGDPYSASVFVSNLGSIGISADYHHLVNWGTNSFFVIIGKKHKHPFFNDDGSYQMQEALKLGFTIDERIADGLYFANSIKLLKHLLENPNLLDLPINAEIKINERRN